MSLLGKVLGGRYEVLRLLGTGGMGAVYEAQQRDLNRRVAIKVLHDTRHDPGTSRGSVKRRRPRQPGPPEHRPDHRLRGEAG